MSEFERECTEFFVEIVQVIGVQRSVGQIFGLLFASPVPLSFTDIVEKLQISKGSASQGLQLLRTIGAVRKATEYSDRREFFEPELALGKLIRGVLREKIEPLVNSGGGRIGRLFTAAHRELAADTRDFSLKRVARIDAWRRDARLLLPVLKSLIGPPEHFRKA